MMKSYYSKKLVIYVAMFFSWSFCFAQSLDVKKGNQLYRSKKYVESIDEYKKVTSPRSVYNTGNSFLRLYQPKDAMEQYEKALQNEKNPWYKGQIYHNEGVILQAQKKYDLAIECYKNALRNNPKDNHARYNLELCKRLKKEQENNQQDQSQNQENTDSNRQEKDQEKQPSPSQSSEKGQQQSQLSKDNAEQMLNVAKQAEQQAQDRVKKNMIKPSPRKFEKNW